MNNTISENMLMNGTLIGNILGTILSVLFISTQLGIFGFIFYLCFRNYSILMDDKKLVIKTDRIKALLLINGSVRAILAIVIVGTYINLIIFGLPLYFYIMKDIAKEIFPIILSAATGIAGTALGFYFGGRQSANSFGEERQNKPEKNASAEVKPTNTNSNGAATVETSNTPGE